jgi:adenylate cyclase
MTRAKRLLVAAGLAPTIAVAVVSLARPALLRPAEDATYDALVRATPARRPSDRIVIVDVDERSLAQLGQWPWRRDVVGALVEKLRALGADVIALDIIFAEPDRYEGDDVRPDAALAATVERGRVVLGYALTFDGEAELKPCVRHPLALAIVSRDLARRDDDVLPLFRASGAVCNLPVLTQAAPASGFLNAAPDPDGLLRRVPLVAEFDGRVYPSLALAAVNAIGDAGEGALHVANANASVLALGDRAIPLDGTGNLLLRYRGPKRTFTYVSAGDVMAGRTPADAIGGKLVFVGTTALGTREVVSTPLDTLFTGVEVQATTADNLLQQDFIHRPEHATAIEAQVVVAAGAVATLLVVAFGLARGLAGSVALLAMLWGGAGWLLSSAGVVLLPLFPGIGLVASIGAMAAAVLVAERKRADRAGSDKAASQRLMIETLLSLTEKRDLETGRHSRRIQEYTRVLARELAMNPAFTSELTPERIELFSSLAPLHDIGKVGVPDRLLTKPGPLTQEELIEFRKHPSYGLDVIETAERQAGVRDDATLAVAKDIVFTHHEKWDGSGYPRGLRGSEIPIVGRIVAVVDAYDALRSRRPYHDPVSHEQASAEIVSRRGTQFDPAVVDAFVCGGETLRQLAASNHD